MPHILPPAAVSPYTPGFRPSFGGTGGWRDTLMNRVAFAPEDGSGGGAPGGGNPTPAEPQTFSLDYVRELRAENKGWRLKASELERTATEAKTAAEKAAADLKAATEKASKEAEERITQARSAADQRVIRAELRAQAIKAGMVDLDGLKLLDTSAVKLNEDGEPEVPADFFEKAKAAKPYLFVAQTGAEHGKTTNPKPAPKPAAPSTKAAAELKDDEYAAELAALTRPSR